MKKPILAAFGPLTESELHWLRVLEDSATSGPWIVGEHDPWTVRDGNKPVHKLFVGHGGMPQGTRDKVNVPNAAFVVGVRNLLPRLLAELEELRKYRDEHEWFKGVLRRAVEKSDA